jgi:hypothetical protein
MILKIGDGAIRKLSSAQRSFLIDHVDGEVELTPARRHLIQVRNSLMKMKLLRGAIAHTIRPRGTVLTEHGRYAVGVILGDYADGLVRAGLLEQENPLWVLKQLKALGGFPAGRPASQPAEEMPEPASLRSGLPG